MTRSTSCDPPREWPSRIGFYSSPSRPRLYAKSPFRQSAETGNALFLIFAVSELQGDTAPWPLPEGSRRILHSLAAISYLPAVSVCCLAVTENTGRDQFL